MGRAHGPTASPSRTLRNPCAWPATGPQERSRSSCTPMTAPEPGSGYLIGSGVLRFDPYRPSSPQGEPREEHATDGAATRGGTFLVVHVNRCPGQFPVRRCKRQRPAPRPRPPRRRDQSGYRIVRYPRGHVGELARLINPKFLSAKRGAAQGKGAELRAALHGLTATRIGRCQCGRDSPVLADDRGFVRSALR
jgi:hypothetical protein